MKLKPQVHRHEAQWSVFRSANLIPPKVLFDMSVLVSGIIGNRHIDIYRPWLQSSTGFRICCTWQCLIMLLFLFCRCSSFVKPFDYRHALPHCALSCNVLRSPSHSFYGLRDMALLLPIELYAGHRQSQPMNWSPTKSLDSRESSEDYPWSRFQLPR